MINDEARKKAEKQLAAKERLKIKALKKESPEVDKDSFDAVLDESNKSLSDKLGLSPKAKGTKAKKAKTDGFKQTKLAFAPKETPEKKSDIDEFDAAMEQAIPLR